jgi:HSP20 family protein
MALVQYQPWSLINQLHQDIDSLFSRAERSDTSAATADWVPATDIAEYADRFELTVDLPGVDVRAIELSLSDGVLSVSGERSEIKAANGDTPVRHRQERAVGRFHRRFILPDTVDAENVRAKGDNGVVHITIPKTPAVQPRRIAIR